MIKLDLSDISCGPAKNIIKIGKDWDLDDHFEISLGEISLLELTGSQQGQWTLSAYWRDGWTDFEHDSAKILSLPLVGVKLTMVYYSTVLQGFVGGGGASDCRIPPEGYLKTIMDNPYTHECERCKGEESHMILPEGFYCPPANPNLFKKIVGRPVEIRLAP